MSHSLESGLKGFAVGFIGFMMLVHITGKTPAHIQRSIHQEAVNLGYGQWVTITNSNSNGYAPITSFQWITNNIPSK